ncbi:MAG: flippase-like domain-containing protein [Bacteroidota bacterium]|nr:flippase-like domain-containing protein [Bacteroidota bacterium]
MNKKIFSVLKYIFFLGIGVFLMWWQLSKMTPVQRIQFHDSLQNADYLILIPIVIMAILSHISRAIRWKILIEPMGYRPSTFNTFYATLCGYFANTFIPRAGEILRCTLLGRYEKIPVTKLIGTILVERVFDLFCYFFLILFTILIQIGTVSDFVKKKLLEISAKQNIIPLWVKLLILALLIYAVVQFIKWLFIKHANHRHIIKLKGIHIGLKEGFSSIKHLQKRKAFLLHTFFIWSMYLLQIYVGFNALTATSSLGLPAALSVLSLATLAMIVAPGGIGAFPVAIQQVLLIYKIDNISFGWLMWGVTTGIVIIAGSASFVLLIYTNKRKNETGK